MQERKPQPNDRLHVDRMQWEIVHRGPALPSWEQKLAEQEAMQRLQKLRSKQV